MAYVQNHSNQKQQQDPTPHTIIVERCFFGANKLTKHIIIARAINTHVGHQKAPTGALK